MKLNFEAYKNWLDSQNSDLYPYEIHAIQNLIDRCKELENAIRKHRDQIADDRCVFDDEELYEVLGEEIKCDRRVGSKEQMLENCRRFIDNRCEGGHWPTYKQLHDSLLKIKSLCQSAIDEPSTSSHPLVLSSFLGRLILEEINRVKQSV